jgi:hypothetical protein
MKTVLQYAIIGLLCGISFFLGRNAPRPVAIQLTEAAPLKDVASWQGIEPVYAHWEDGKPVLLGVVVRGEDFITVYHRNK